MFPKQIRAVLFDLDGVLINSEDAYFQAIAAYIQDKTGKTFSKGDFNQIFGLHHPLLLHQLALEYHLKDSAEQMDQEINRRVNFSHIQIKPAAQALVQFCRNQGMKIAMVTNSRRPNLIDKIQHLNIAEWFDQVVTVDRVEHGKPEPDLYQEAARLLGLPTKECLAVDDTIPGAQSAIAAGCTVYWVPNPYLSHPERLSLQLPVNFFPTLTDVLKYWQQPEVKPFMPALAGPIPVSLFLLASLLVYGLHLWGRVPAEQGAVQGVSTVRLSAQANCSDEQQALLTAYLSRERNYQQTLAQLTDPRQIAAVNQLRQLEHQHYIDVSQKLAACSTE